MVAIFFLLLLGVLALGDLLQETVQASAAIIADVGHGSEQHPDFATVRCEQPAFEFVVFLLEIGEQPVSQMAVVRVQVAG